MNTGQKQDDWNNSTTGENNNPVMNNERNSIWCNFSPRLEWKSKLRKTVQVLASTYDFE